MEPSRVIVDRRIGTTTYPRSTAWRTGDGTLYVQAIDDPEHLTVLAPGQWLRASTGPASTPQYFAAEADHD